MKLVSGITNQPKQQMTLVLDEGSSVFITLNYYPQQIGWFMDVRWQTWVVLGLRVTTSPNILRQWKNVIPFGLAVSGKNEVEPLNPDDFVDGTISVYVLQGEDLTSIEEAAFA